MPSSAPDRTSTTEQGISHANRKRLAMKNRAVQLRQALPRGVPARLLALAGLCAALAVATTGQPPGAIAAGGTFPGTPFNGMSISYSIDGAELWAPLDRHDFTTSRTYHGRILGPVLRVSGTVSQDWGYGASLSVEVSAGGERKTFTAEGENPWRQNYDVAVPVPPGTTTGSVSVRMVGYYNVGTRGLVVSAYLDNTAPTDTPQPSATPTPTATPAYDLQVGDIEMTQVIQCLHTDVGAAACADNSIDMVRGKRTALRVYPLIQAAEQQNRPPNNQPVTFELSLAAGGAKHAPVNEPALWNEPASKLRRWRDLTANFHLPNDWTRQERVSLKVTINPDRSLPETDYENNSKEITIDFQRRRSFTVRYHPVRLLLNTPKGAKKVSADKAVYKTGPRILQQWFPVADGGVVYRRGIGLTYWGQFDSAAAHPPRAEKQALLKWIDRQAAIPKLLGAPADQTVAWIHMPAVAGDFWYGLSDPPWANPPGGGRTVLVRAYSGGEYGLAHEVAHNLGARHPNREPSGCGAADPNTDWPYADATIQEVGYDLWSGKKQGAIVPASRKDLMTYCADNRKWMSPHTYRLMYNSLAPKAGQTVGVLGPARALTQASGELAIVSGTIHRDGRAELDPLIRVVAAADAASPPSSGPYCIELTAVASGPTESRCFDVDFLDHDRQPVDSETFLFTIPVPAGAERLRLSRSGGALAERRASAHPPTVRVLEPGASALWDGPHTVRWEAADADGDPLTYTVGYSQDGADWQMLNADLTASELEIDTTELPGGTAARIRVWASDGFHTASADGGPFRVPPKPPQPVILEPRDGTVLSVDAPLDLLGGGDDPEDGAIDEETFQWSSDRDGQLGTGASLTVPRLSEGTHLLRLTARDQDGNSGSDTILVHVRRPLVFLPLAVRASDIRSLARPTVGPPPPTATRPASTELAARLVAEVNRVRVRAGLSPLAAQPNLSEAAAWYARDMAEGNYRDGDGYDRQNREPADRARAFGYEMAGFASWRLVESVGVGADRAAAMVERWLANTVDRSNLLDPRLCHIGAGHALSPSGQQGDVWVADMGCRDVLGPTPPATRTATKAPPSGTPTPSPTRPTATPSLTAEWPTVGPSPTGEVETLTPPPLLTPTEPTPEPSATPSTPGTLIFGDDFCDVRSGWPTHQDADVVYGYVLGMLCHYRIYIRPADRWLWVKPGVSAGADFDLEVTASMTGSGAAGLMFGLTADRRNFYVFLIDTAQRFGLYFRDGDTWRTVVPRTGSSRIDPAWGNRLRVESRGTGLGLYIDGTLVNGIDDGRAHNGEVGLYAESGTASFDGRYSEYRLYRTGGN